MTEAKVATLVCMECGRTFLLDNETVEIAKTRPKFPWTVWECMNEKCKSWNTRIVFTTPARKEAFRKLSSETALSYWARGGWSSFELEVKEILEELGLEENKDYWHNWKLHSPSKSFYSVDFLFPDKRLVLEADGEVWHGLGNSKKKDEIRTAWLERLGLRVVHLKGKDFFDHEKLRKKILEVLGAGVREVQMP